MNKSNLKPINVSDQNIAACNDLGKCKIHYKISATRCDMIDYNTAVIPRNVVIYARVSTEHEAQFSALENQLDWYKPLLEQRPEWTLVHSYVDEGITGPSAKKRPQFMKMLEDAQSGEFQLILTREVSRFARNTVDTLQYIRQLKAMGVEVFFINDNIRTFDGDGDAFTNISSTKRCISTNDKDKNATCTRNGTPEPVGIPAVLSFR